MYLSVDCPNDGSSQAHAWDKADMKVLLQDERLHSGTHKQQAGVEVALPGGSIWVVDKVDQQPGQLLKKLEKKKKKKIFQTSSELTHCNYVSSCTINQKYQIFQATSFGLMVLTCYYSWKAQYKHISASL